MKTIYAIRDRIANDLIGNAMYLLMVFRTDQEAVRYFTDAILDEKSILAKHPSDYELIKIADIDNTGDIVAEFNTIIITGAAVIAVTEPQLVKES